MSQPTTPGAGLRTLYRSSPEARRVLDNLAGRQRDNEFMTTETAARIAACDENTALQLLRGLADDGVGEVKLGRHGNKTRLIWFYRLHSIGGMAQGKLSALEDLVPAADGDPGNDANLTTHHFSLRPDLKVTFKLPGDITKREAERLAGLIQNIPYE